MAKQVVSLSQLLDKENRRREGLMNSSTLLKQGSNGTSIQKRPFPRQPNCEPNTTNSNDYYCQQFQANKTSSQSQQSTYTSDEYQSQSQSLVHQEYSQDNAVPLTALLQSRYSRMLVGSHELQPSQQMVRNTHNKKAGLNICTSQQTVTDTMKNGVSQGEFEAFVREVALNFELIEDHRIRCEELKMRRQEEKQSKAIEVEKSREAKKLVKHDAIREAKEAKARRKEEKRQLELQEKGKSEMEEAARVEEKKIRRQKKDDMVNRTRLEIRALHKRILKLERMMENESKDMKTITDEMTSMGKVSKSLLSENRKLKKLVQAHHNAVSEGTAVLRSSIGAIGASISNNTKDLLHSIDTWRDASNKQEESMMGQMRLDASSACIDDAFAITDSDPLNDDAHDEIEIELYGESFVQDLIQCAREKKRKKLMHEG